MRFEGNQAVTCIHDNITTHGQEERLRSAKASMSAERTTFAFAAPKFIS